MCRMQLVNYKVIYHFKWHSSLKNNHFNTIPKCRITESLPWSLFWWDFASALFIQIYIYIGVVYMCSLFTICLGTSKKDASLVESKLLKWKIRDEIKSEKAFGRKRRVMWWKRNCLFMLEKNRDKKQVGVVTRTFRSKFNSECGKTGSQMIQK